VTDPIATVHDVQSFGWTAPGFESLRTAFESNLRVGDELGASFAVFRHGECVADLWGGHKTPGGDRYPEDALQFVFSTSKGLLGLCLAALVDDDAIDLDAPVAYYWPEFAEAGKATISVRQAASHQAGLPGFTTPTTLSDLGDWDKCAAKLAAQEPYWTPGEHHGYHAITIGYLIGEVIRRVTDKTVGQFFRDTFADSLEIDAWIGLPPEQAARVVALVEPRPANGVGDILIRAEKTPDTMTNIATGNPPIPANHLNNPKVWEFEIPSLNAIADARSLARVYSSVVDGPLRSISEQTIREMTVTHVDGSDLVLIDQPTRFGACFMLAAPREPMLGPGSFGHNGRGGSLAFAHPRSGITYAFVTNRIVNDPAPDRRNTRLLAALTESLRKTTAR
jgi:CubicO group peptidase (beta-lactamase class C family)